MTTNIGSGSVNYPPSPTSNLSTWKVTSQDAGSATTGGTLTITLDNGYELQLDENSSEIKIINNCTTPPEVTTISGDRHLDWDGQAGDEGCFFGNTCFVLTDDTKITVNTLACNDGREWLANNVVVTKGDQALIVDGLAQTNKGDFKVYQGINGRALDKAIDDGRVTTVYENANGIGWVTEKGGCDLASKASFGKTTAENWNANPSADLRKQLEALYGNSSPGGGSSGQGGGNRNNGGGGARVSPLEPYWLRILGRKFGDQHGVQAKRLEEVARQIQEHPNDKERPSISRSHSSSSSRTPPRP